MLDLETREQRNIVLVALDDVNAVGHDRAHEGTRLLVDLVRVDQDLANVGVEVVTYGAHHQAALEVDQGGCFLGLGGTLDGIPQLL